MAAEADTSGSELLVSDNRHHYRRQRQSHTQDNCSTGENHAFRRYNETNDDEVEKLICVDEFDDSDDEEDIRSCSTTSPTPSDQAVNSSMSSRHVTSGSKAKHRFNNKYKMRKKQQLDSEPLDEDELQSLRLKINSRERKRMHDLNSALDGLREVMPYAHGPSVRKLSKIATLLLAKNYILMLNSSLEEMKKLVNDIYHNHGPIPAGDKASGCRSVDPQSAPTNSGPLGSSNSSRQQIKPSTDRLNTSLSNGSHTPTNKSTDVLTNVSYPPTAMPLAHLTQHHTHIPSVMPLSLAGLRTMAHGLASREINSLVSPYPLPKSETNNGMVISQLLPSRECTRRLHPWGMPCTCAPFMSSSGNLPLSVHPSRFSHPMVTSAALHRKN